MAKQFLHPGENRTLSNIVKFCETYQFIARFILKYGTFSQDDDEVTRNDAGNFIHCEKATSKSVLIAIHFLSTGNHLRKGLYLQTLAESLNLILEPYRNEIIDMEKRYLNKPDYSLMFIHSVISEYGMFFSFLKRSIIELKTQKYHGCAILQFLQRHNCHGDEQITEAMKTVRKNVHGVFLQQLTQWLMNGELVDTYNEFFIQHIESEIREQTQHELSGATSITEKSPTSERTASTVHSDLWHYEIRYDMLPLNLSPSWAEKVLFIGQTVVMLRSDLRDKSKRKAIWRDDEPDVQIGSLWNGQEQIYSNKLQILYTDEALDVNQYESIIDDIKNYVTERLSDIAFKQADLIRHLKLVKEFFLLGRGELFLEFIKQTETIQSDSIDQRVARDVSRAFQTAANRTNNDLERISMHLPLNELDVASIIDESQIFLQLVQLKFNVKWPLHLFFSPTILKRYNDLFRFLLQIRKLQNDLHIVWAHHREKKMAKGNQLAQIRCKLMFFIDNLQYYLQADVLESQFSILMNAVLNSKDFEYIQRAHSVFQANIMSLCFLLNTATVDSASAGISLNRASIPPGANGDEQDNPVLIILHRIMRCINTFCVLNLTCDDPMTAEQAKELKFNDQR